MRDCKKNCVSLWKETDPGRPDVEDAEKWLFGLRELPKYPIHY
jgi:hypothetical protein